MSGEDTRERILEAAEQLFAENGFAATSIRAITAKAGVNLAALNYHFGSKDGLIDSIFKRRIGSLNSERIRLLDMVESKHEEVTLEEVLEAFLGPAIRLASDPSSGGKVFMRLMGRAHTEPGDFFVVKISKHFDKVFGRFSASIQRLLPHLSSGELFWRIHFVVGAMAITMSQKLTLRHLESFETLEGKFGEDVIEPEAAVVLDRLVAFAAAGLRTEMVEAGEGEN